MCYAWISEQIAIVHLYSINLSVFITEAESVYCAVWTGSLNRTDRVSSLKGWVSHSRLDGGTLILSEMSHWSWRSQCKGRRRRKSVDWLTLKTETLCFFRHIGNIPEKSNFMTKYRLYCSPVTKFYDVMMACGDGFIRYFIYETKLVFPQSERKRCLLSASSMNS
jgi:hypothetical protein